jgi:DNA-binding Lrp family transcriptional regulator
MFDMYVLVICDLKSSFLIASKIQSIEEVSDVYALYGVYNLLVKISAPSCKDLEYAYHKIRHMEGIGSTLCLIGQSPRQKLPNIGKA